MRSTVLVRRIASGLCLAAILAAPIGAETFLIQSGEDSSPYSFTPNTPRGFRSTAYAFTNYEGNFDHSFEYFIRFDLPTELFEPGVEIESALAWVYYGYDYTVFGDTTTEVGEVACRTVLGAWNQATLTWNNRPPVGPVFDGWVNVTKKGMYWCDVKDLVEAWISGDPNHGIAITSDMPRVMGYHTYDDGSVSPNFRPSLLVHTVPEPRAGLWAGVALLLALRRCASRSPRTSASNHETRQEPSMRLPSIVLTAVLALAALPGSAQVFQSNREVDFDRWMYPFNGTPGIRNLAPTFGAVSDAPDFDNRDGQFIVAIDTVAAGIPKNQGAANYNPLRIRVRASHFDGFFSYDPTYDAWQTYLDPAHPSYVADSDSGRPIELYGVGFRNGYVGPLVIGAITSAGPPGFEENERHCEGCGAFGQAKRNIFAYDPGVPDPESDVSNNVVRLAPLTGGGFNPSPWAIGKSTSGLAPGATVPQGTFGANAGETFLFELNLADPDVLTYVRNGLNAGVLGFAITSMHLTEQQAGGSNPNFYTRDNIDTAAIAPRMDLIVSLPEPGVGTGLACGLGLIGSLRRRRRQIA